MKYLFFTLLIISGILASAQQDRFRNWKILEKIDYTKAKDEYGEYFVPKFSEEIKKLEGTEISLPGYIIPFEGMFKPDQLILSSLPIASCFFCGTGGPETVAQIYLKEDVKYTAKLVTVRGILTLNDTDTDQLMYILKEATVASD